MSSVVSSLTGASGGAGGTGFQAPAQANLTNPTNPQQIQQAYDAAQTQLKQQQDLLAAIQAQGGLQNQSNVYNQLQDIVAGRGPNPAQAQLAQATGANTANQAALMAGQRGAGANVGLIARQAAQQGGANQQNAAGQAATLQAQQSLNALTGAGNLATTQASNQMGQQNFLTQAQQAEQGQLLGAQNAYNTAQTGSQASVNAGNTALANTQLQGQQALVGGALKGLSAAFAAEGGRVQSYADGSPDVVAPVINANAGPSKWGKFFKGATGSDQAASQTPSADLSSTNSSLGQGASAAGEGLGKGLKSLFSSSKGQANYAGSDVPASDVMVAAHGGKVPAMVSPGEQYIPPHDIPKVEAGANPLQVGERIPGKPKVKGNSYTNDVVPKTLEEGGIVIPNSIMQSKNAAEKAAKFVAAHKAQRDHKPKKASK